MSISSTSSFYGALGKVHLAKWVALLFPSLLSLLIPSGQVRVVQHKQSKDLYALKYINKAKCVKMRAVANIVQERRLLEEVRRRSSAIPLRSIQC